MYVFENLLFMLPWQPIKLNNSDKSLMKCGELFNKHFCIIPNETVEISNFHFFHYKSMETCSCHSKPESLSDWNKKHNCCTGYYRKQVCQVSASSPLSFLRRRFLNIFTKTYPFCRPDNQSNSPIWTKVI